MTLQGIPISSNGTPDMDIGRLKKPWHYETALVASLVFKFCLPLPPVLICPKEYMPWLMVVVGLFHDSHPTTRSMGNKPLQLCASWPLARQCSLRGIHSVIVASRRWNTVLNPANPLVIDLLDVGAVHVLHPLAVEDVLLSHPLFAPVLMRFDDQSTPSPCFFVDG